MTRNTRNGRNRFDEQVINPVNFVNYQVGSVVSRIIIERKTGNVTIFAFDEGQGLSEHTVPYDAVVHILEGEAEITISGKTCHLKTGELVVLPANQPHALSARKQFKMLLTMIQS